MATTQEIMTVARNAAWVDRVRYHLTKAAADVMAEGADTAGHAKRVAYAAKVLDGSADYQSAAIAVLTNATIAGKVTTGAADFGVPDADLPYTVNTLISALAGAAL